MTYGQTTNQPTKRVAVGRAVDAGRPVLKPRRQLVSVNGVKGSAEQIRKQIDSARCAGPPTNGCVATQPV